MLLIINAEIVDISVIPGHLPLLDFLRDIRGLTAAKPGCGTGDCGACLVLLGEIPPGESLPVWRVVNSCLLTLSHVDGCQVITPEGLNGPSLNAVQQALADHGAVQCGYCTPGLMVAITAALLRGEVLSEAASGNLCRCTGYAGIRRALEALKDRFDQEKRTPDALVTLGLLRPDVAAATSALRPLPESRLFSGLAAVSGGHTDLGVRYIHGSETSPRLLLHRVPGLRAIAADNCFFRIGAAVTVAELQADTRVLSEWPALSMALLRFASPSIRQMATVGGNLVNASPVADLAVLLLAMSAELELSSANGNRRLPLSAFYRDYKQTALHPEEILTTVLLPRNTDQPRRLHFDKVSHRDRDDIATVNTALVEAGGLPGCFGLLTVSAGGVGPCPLLLQAFADSVQGRAIGPDVVRSALSRVDADIRPISDHRGSADYKRHLLQHLLASHLCALHPELVFTECLP